jgi:hypothetical protein
MAPATRAPGAGQLLRGLRRSPQNQVEQAREPAVPLSTTSAAAGNSPHNNGVQRGLNMHAPRDDDENALDRLASLLSSLAGYEAALTLS